MNIIDDNFSELLKSIKIENKSINFFDIISPKEVIVSEWLAFIFDPSKNGAGNITINKLLEAIGLDYNINELNFIETTTELSTNKGQRMDIVIKYDGLWIIIENKIESEETGKQTEDYFEYIESVKGNNEVIYIYLKPNYNKSIPKKLFKDNTGFRILTYNVLIQKLKQISEFEYIEKDKYKYLKEFLVSGDRFMRNEKLEYNEAVIFYMNNKYKIEAIENEYKKQNKKLHEKLRYDLLNYLNKNGDNYKTDDDKGISPRSYIQYYLDGWKNETHNGAHFELLFHTDRILSSNVNCEVVLHLESKITEEYLEKFKLKGITKIRSLAFDTNRGQSVSYKLELDFSSIEKYNKSLEFLCKALDKIISEYQSIVIDALK